MPTGPRTTDAAPESRREEVLLSASRVIMREGLEGTSMRRIAREGGFTTGVLTHHFVDKRELITACFEWTMARFLDAAAARLGAAGSAEAHIEAFVRIAVPSDPERHGEWRLWFEACSAAIRDERAAATLVEMDMRWEALIAASVERWQRDGVIRPDLDAEVTAVLLARLIDGLCLRSLAGGRWDEARTRLVQELRMLGVSDDLAGRLLSAPTGGER